MCLNTEERCAKSTVRISFHTTLTHVYASSFLADSVNNSLRRLGSLSLQAPFPDTLPQIIQVSNESASIMRYHLNSKSQLRVEDCRIPAQGKYRPRLEYCRRWGRNSWAQPIGDNSITDFKAIASFHHHFYSKMKTILILERKQILKYFNQQHGAVWSSQFCSAWWFLDAILL